MSGKRRAGGGVGAVGPGCAATATAAAAVAAAATGPLSVKELHRGDGERSCPRC